jgi:hypothetical protein
MVNVCMYGGFGSNGFVTKTQPFPMDGHYKTDIISGVSHPKLNSVVSLMLCTVACNGLGTDIVLQVPWNIVNLVENHNLSLNKQGLGSGSLGAC